MNTHLRSMSDYWKFAFGLGRSGHVNSLECYGISWLS